MGLNPSQVELGVCSTSESYFNQNVSDLTKIYKKFTIVFKITNNTTLALITVIILGPKSGLFNNVVHISTEYFTVKTSTWTDCCMNSLYIVS